MLFPPPGTTTGGLGCPPGLLELPAVALEDIDDGEEKDSVLSESVKWTVH